MHTNISLQDLERRGITELAITAFEPYQRYEFDMKKWEYERTLDRKILGDRWENGT